MIHIRKGQDRGKTKTDWLDSSHSFSFADYIDPKFMGFGNLRVINEDIVQPGMGFGRHPHRDMEIISYVVEGSLEHKDSMGNGSVIRPGEIQMLTAGTGIEHSEFNHSKTELLHFLQIWIIPENAGLQPNYQQKSIQKLNNEFILLASKNISNAALKIHQDVNLFLALMTEQNSLDYPLPNDRMAWLQLIKGEIQLNGETLLAGDGATIQNEPAHIDCLKNAELLFFDLGTDY